MLVGGDYYQLKIVNPEVDKRWDEFVMKNQQGSIYHHSAWGSVLKSTYKYVLFYVALENIETGQFEGIIPFMKIDSWLTGKRLVSLPYTTYCNPLIPKEHLMNVIRFVFEHHSEIDYSELKCIERDKESAFEFFEKNSTYVTHILPLDIPLEELFRSFHNTSVRQRIKRAEKNKLKLRIAEKEDDLKTFYALEINKRKKLGLPPQPYDFFANIWHILKPKNLLFVPLVEYEGKVIAAAIVLKFKNIFYFEYSASDQNFLKLCPNQKLIWEIIKLAHEEGASYLDFGRSSIENSFLIEFKERWGAKRYNLSYYYFPKGNKLKPKEGFKRKIFELINSCLPNTLLQLEGKLISSHLG